MALPDTESMEVAFLCHLVRKENIGDIILSLNKINAELNLGLKIEGAKDGPCEDGRNINAEFRSLPPQITIENVDKAFSNYGVVIDKRESDEGFILTFSDIFETLPLLSLINPHINSGSKWFCLFKNRPTQCRFVSSISCSKCSLQGHHYSRCPDGLAEKVKILRKPVLQIKSLNASTSNNHNTVDTSSTSSSKKSVKRQSFSIGDISKDPKNDVDNKSKGKPRKSRNVKEKIIKNSLSIKTTPPLLSGKLSDRLSGFLSSSSVNDSSLLLGNSMDTSLDSQDSELIKKHGSLDPNLTLSTKPDISGIDVKLFANEKTKKTKKKKNK